MSETNLLEEAVTDTDVPSIIEAPAPLPAKFLDPETGEIRVELLVKSYQELERKLSTLQKQPDISTDREQMLKMLGVPDAADAYQVDVSHGLFTVDSELNGKLHTLGFTPEQVQAVYDLAAEKFVPMILEMAGEFQADREITRLIDTFGGEDKWREISRQLLNYGRKNLSEDVLQGLCGSYDGVMALHRMMESGRKNIAGQGGKNVDLSSEEDVRNLMRDPKYWRERDPQTIAQVTAAFERIYGQ